jgi:cyclic pyranopterin phosphate synthase
MRSGAGDEELRQIVREAVWRKELKHRVSEPGFRQPLRSMSQIGG